MNYPYIRAYGKMNGSDQSYIEDEMRKAAQDKAPQDAWSYEGGVSTDPRPRKWRTLAGLDEAAQRGNMTAAETAEKLRAPMRRRSGGT